MNKLPLRTAKFPGDVKRPRCSCGKWQYQQRRFAFTAVIVSDNDLIKNGFPATPPGQNWIIGRADEGTRGYSPIVVEGCFEEEKEARARAAALNKLAGWKDEGEAQMLVLTTMHVKEDHLASLLSEAVKLIKGVMSGECGCLSTDPVHEWLERAKPYAKEAE